MMLKTESSLKAAGMESCARHYRDELMKAKRLAFECAIEKGEITASDVRDEAERRGITLPFNKIGGSLFRGNLWEKVAPSTARNPGSHNHTLWIWKLRNPPKPVMAVPVQKVDKKPVFSTELFEIPQIINLP